MSLLSSGEGKESQGGETNKDTLDHGEESGNSVMDKEKRAELVRHASCRVWNAWH